MHLQCLVFREKILYCVKICKLGSIYAKSSSFLNFLKVEFNYTFFKRQKKKSHIHELEPLGSEKAPRHSEKHNASAIFW